MFEDKKFNRMLTRRSRRIGRTKPRRDIRGCDAIPAQGYDLLYMMQRPEVFLHA